MRPTSYYPKATRACAASCRLHTRCQTPGPPEYIKLCVVDLTRLPALSAPQRRSALTRYSPIGLTFVKVMISFVGGRAAVGCPSTLKCFSSR